MYCGALYSNIHIVLHMYNECYQYLWFNPEACVVMLCYNQLFFCTTALTNNPAYYCENHCNKGR